MNDIFIEEKYATIVALSLVSIEHIEIVRDYVSTLGEDLLDLFDSLWVRDDELKKEKVIKLNVKQKLVNRQ